MKSVVIVEDEPDLAALLTDILESFGYSVVVTTPGQAAACTEETRPALVLMDYTMPGMNGGEVAAEIRAAMGATAPRIVLVTGRENASELARDAGIDAYLRKPFDVDDFVTLVDRLTAGAA